MSTKCLIVDRFWFSPLIVTKPPLHHMNSTLSKSRVRDIFNRCGHMVSVSRRFAVEAKRRANVDHKVLPSDQWLHCLNHGRITSHFHLSDQYRKVFWPCRKRSRHEWDREREGGDREHKNRNAKQKENESRDDDRQQIEKGGKSN